MAIEVHIIFLYFIAITLNIILVLVILPFKKLRNATKKEKKRIIGFAVPCQHWKLAWKHFFWGKELCTWLPIKVVLDLKIFFNCSFLTYTLIWVNYSFFIFLLKSWWFSQELSSIYLIIVFQICSSETFLRSLRLFSFYGKGSMCTL